MKYGIEACKLFHRDKLARTLWSNGKMLNPVQIQAVELALCNNFQLIQGPPGWYLRVYTAEVFVYS